MWPKSAMAPRRRTRPPAAAPAPRLAPRRAGRAIPPTSCWCGASSTATRPPSVSCTTATGGRPTRWPAGSARTTGSPRTSCRRCSWPSGGTRSGSIPQRGSFGTWLLTLVHHKSVDAVRRESAIRRRTVPAAEDGEEWSAPPGPGADQAALGAVVAGQVRDALGQLPAEQRQALALAYYGGYTQREVATHHRRSAGHREVPDVHRGAAIAQRPRPADRRHRHRLPGWCAMNATRADLPAQRAGRRLGAARARARRGDGRADAPAAVRVVPHGGRRGRGGAVARLGACRGAGGPARRRCGTG